jgi:(p)ppGpp synthase/HD superfamily hydrolase
VVVELASRLDTLRNIEQLRPYDRPIVALETMQLYAPMAHALRVDGVREELEDRAFAVSCPPPLSRADMTTLPKGGHQLHRTVSDANS